MRSLVRRYPPALFLWLLIVWFLLWGTFDVATVVYGVLVAIAVMVLFPLPPITSRFHIRPLRFVRLVVFLVVDIIISAAQVAWHAIRHGPHTKGAVVAVTALSDVDHVIALAAGVLSLGPGASVLQIDREGGVLYLYVLGPRDEAEVAKAHDDAMSLQARVIGAFGTAAEVDALAERVSASRRAGEVRS